VQAGNPLPVGGAQPFEDGVNFVLFSRNATRVRLEFYQNADDSSPIKIIDLDPTRHRTGGVWHVWVRGVPVGQLYGYRIEGPYQPELGHRFNPHKLLLDPFAKAIAGVEEWDFSAARDYDSSSSLSDLSIPPSITQAALRNASSPATFSTGRRTRLRSILPPTR
jgi:glycogen operon protein